MKWNKKLLLVAIVALGLAVLLGFPTLAKRLDKKAGTPQTQAKSGNSSAATTLAAPQDPNDPIEGRAVAFGVSAKVSDLPPAQADPPQRDKFGNLILTREVPNGDQINEIVPGAGAGGEQYATSPFI